MANQDLKKAEESLRSRIFKARSKVKSDDIVDGKKASNPLRYSIEMISGVIVGGGIGYYLDKFFDTLPVFFLIFFFLGVAAGSLNIYKLALKSDKNE